MRAGLAVVLALCAAALVANAARARLELARALARELGRDLWRELGRALAELYLAPWMRGEPDPALRLHRARKRARRALWRARELRA